MPALPQLYPYKSGPIESICMPGENVGIWVNKVYEFYKVLYIEGIMRSNPTLIDLGALAAGAATAVTQLTFLEMPDLEFAQYRAEVLDDVEVILYQGRADQRHKTNSRVATYNRSLRQQDPDGHTGEFYVFEDNFAFMQATNNTDYALAQARVVFWGFRYVCEVLEGFSWKRKQLPDVWTRVPGTAHL